MLLELQVCEWLPILHSSLVSHPSANHRSPWTFSPTRIHTWSLSSPLARSNKYLSYRTIQLGWVCVSSIYSAACPSSIFVRTRAQLALQKGPGTGTKRPADALDYEPEPIQKQHRPSTDLVSRETSSSRLDPIRFWAIEGQWPQEYFEQNVIEHILTQKRPLRSLRSLSSLTRTRSDSSACITPSDQKPREEKSMPYRDPYYKLLLEANGTYQARTFLSGTSSTVYS